MAPFDHRGAEAAVSFEDIVPDLKRRGVIRGFCFGAGPSEPLRAMRPRGSIRPMALFDNLRRLVTELRRRRVFRVAVVYATVGFVLIQGADLIFPALVMPDWAYRLLVVLVLLGLPVALVLAWAFELTPEGMKRTAPAPAEPPAGRSSTVRSLGYAGLALVVIGIATYLLLGRSGARRAAQAELERMLATVEDPPSPTTARYLASALAELDRADDAVQMLERTEPRGAWLHFYL